MIVLLKLFSKLANNFILVFPLGLHRLVDLPLRLGLPLRSGGGAAKHAAGAAEGRPHLDRAALHGRGLVAA